MKYFDGTSFPQSVHAAGEQAAQFRERRGFHLPDSRKIRLAVRCPRRGRGQIRLPVPRSRSPGSGMVQPLSLRPHRGCRKSHCEPHDSISQ